MAAPTRTGIIVLVIISSTLLFLAGLFVGLNTQGTIERSVGEDLGRLESNVDSELVDLRTYLDEAALDVKNIQLQQLLVENIHENPCGFREEYLDLAYSQLDEYWSLLPARLEAYERENELDNQYVALKREYMRLSLRFWMNAETTYRQCPDARYVPLLYFYTPSCDDCVEQGEQLDILGERVMQHNRTLLVFAIDASFADDSIFLLKEHYDLEEFPAIVVSGQIYEGSVIAAETLEQLI